MEPILNLKWFQNSIKKLMPFVHCQDSVIKWGPVIYSVRHRYHSEKIAKGPTLKNYGYKETLLTKGLLPHIEHKNRLPKPIYKPKNSWSEKRALFGQNDYIDILGDESIRPHEVCYDVPFWLRGFKGDEYKMLIRRRNIFGKRMAEETPKSFMEMNKRIKYLYRYLNHKTKDYMWKKA